MKSHPPLPRGRDFGRLRVPEFGPRPQLAYDQVLHPDEYENDRYGGETKEELEALDYDGTDDPEQLKGIIRKLLNFMADKIGEDDPSEFEGGPRQRSAMDRRRAGDRRRAMDSGLRGNEDDFYARFPELRHIQQGSY